MALLTPEQIDELRKIIRDASAALAIATTGMEITDEELQRLVDEGYIRPEEITNLTMDSFEFGRLQAKLPGTDQMTYAQFKAYLERNPVELSDRERRAYELAKDRAGQYCVGLGTRYSGEVGGAVIELSEDLEREFLQGIRDEVSQSLVRRDSIGKLTTRLRQMSEDWARDWGRIASTESQFAHQQAKLEGTIQEHGEEAMMAKVPEPTACPDCRRLYLGPDKLPIIRPASWWHGQGVSNVGLKRAEWKPVLGAVHPWCQCQLVRVPAGMGFNAQWDLVPTSMIEKSAGPYIGPRGGKWADPAHTIPWVASATSSPWARLAMYGVEESSRSGGASGAMLKTLWHATSAGYLNQAVAKIRELVRGPDVRGLARQVEREVNERLTSAVVETGRVLSTHPIVVDAAKQQWTRLPGNPGQETLARSVRQMARKLSHNHDLRRVVHQNLSPVMPTVRSALAQAMTRAARQPGGLTRWLRDTYEATAKAAMSAAASLGLLRMTPLLAKGGAPAGTVHEWTTGPHEKQADGSWKPVAKEAESRQLSLFDVANNRVTEKDREPLTHRPPPVAVPAEIKDALERGAYLVINSSGGKDSQALTYAIASAPELAAHRDQMLVVHADLGRAEWPGAGEHARKIAERFGLPFHVVQRDAWENPETGKREPWEGDMLTHFEQRAAWAGTLGRFCTSDMKTGPIWKWLRNNLAGEGVPVISALGIRKQEGEHDKTSGKSRWFAEEWGRSTQFGKQKGEPREAYEWNPILEWNVEDVWSGIRESGLDRHYAYDLGSSRLSCMFCVMASQGDLMTAAKAHPEALDAWIESERKMRANHEMRRQFWADKIAQHQMDGSYEVANKKHYIRGKGKDPEYRKHGGKPTKGDIEIPKRYLQPFLEYKKGFTLEDLKAKLLKETGVAKSEAVGEALERYVERHDRDIREYGHWILEAEKLLEQVRDALPGKAAELLRQRSAMLDKVAAIGRRLKGSHPFPSRGEDLSGELSAELGKSRSLHYRTTWNGLPISIENRAGSIRRWYDKATETEGETKMRYPYGYIRLTEAADGDHVDCFVGPDENAKFVYVVHQMRAPSFDRYDEDKVMLGFASRAEAKRAYLAHFDQPGFFGSMTAIPTTKFVERAKAGDYRDGDAIRKAEQLALWEPIPKGKKGGQRRRKATGGYEYRYPATGHIAYASHTEHPEVPRAMELARELVLRVKNGDVEATKTVAKAMAKDLQGFRGTIVPAPRSDPTRRPSLMVLAEELVRLGVGDDASDAVQRVKSVPSSRRRRQAGQRGLTAEEHRASMGLKGDIPRDEPILLVDDMWTTGKTLHAMAKTLRDSGHRGPIRMATVGHQVSDLVTYADKPRQPVAVELREEPEFRLGWPETKRGMQILLARQQEINNSVASSPVAATTQIFLNVSGGSEKKIFLPVDEPSGIAKRNLGVQITAHEIPKTAKGMERFARHARAEGLELMVDSGEFPRFVAQQAIDAGKAVSPGQRARAALDFDMVFRQYEALAAVMPPETLTVVAADRVGEPEKTAELRAKYAPQVKRLMEQGVNVIVPLQARTTQTLVDDYIRAADHFGEGFTIGVPMAKKPIEMKELVPFMATLYARGRFPRVHMLGGSEPDLMAKHTVQLVAAAYFAGRGVPVDKAIELTATPQKAIEALAEVKTRRDLLEAQADPAIRERVSFASGHAQPTAADWKAFFAAHPEEFDTEIESKQRHFREMAGKLVQFDTTTVNKMVQHRREHAISGRQKDVSGHLESTEKRLRYAENLDKYLQAREFQIERHLPGYAGGYYAMFKAGTFGAEGLALTGAPNRPPVTTMGNVHKPARTAGEGAWTAKMPEDHPAERVKDPKRKKAKKRKELAERKERLLTATDPRYRDWARPIPDNAQHVKQDRDAERNREQLESEQAKRAMRREHRGTLTISPGALR